MGYKTFSVCGVSKGDFHIFTKNLVFLMSMCFLSQKNNITIIMNFLIYSVD